MAHRSVPTDAARARGSVTRPAAPGGPPPRPGPGSPRSAAPDRPARRPAVRVDHLRRELGARLVPGDQVRAAALGRVTADQGRLTDQPAAAALRRTPALKLAEDLANGNDDQLLYPAVAAGVASRAS